MLPEIAASAENDDMSKIEEPAGVPADLIDHLCRNSQLNAREAEHLVAEVVAYYSQTPDEFLRARHQELQSQGFGNTAIFSMLQLELNTRRFGAKPLTTRQIRRAIYG